MSDGTIFKLSEARAELDRLGQRYAAQGSSLLTLSGLYIEEGEDGALTYACGALRGEWRDGPLCCEDDLRAVLAKLAERKLVIARRRVERKFGITKARVAEAFGLAHKPVDEDLVLAIDGTLQDALECLR